MLWGLHGGLCRSAEQANTDPFLRDTECTPRGGAPRAIASLVVSLGLGALTIVVEQARSTTSDSSETLRNADEVDSLAEELLLLVGVEVEGSKESLAVTRV